MTDKHTPTPWKVSIVRGEKADTARFYIEDKNLKTICDLYFKNTGNEALVSFDNDRANANLIATAPEMLKSLERIMNADKLFADLSKLKKRPKLKLMDALCEQTNARDEAMLIIKKARGQSWK